jgi:hypothetical protein
MLKIVKDTLEENGVASSLGVFVDISFDTFIGERLIPGAKVHFCWGPRNADSISGSLGLRSFSAVQWDHKRF